MDIDLGNPLTIVVFLVFGIGGQLWVEWFKQQMQLAEKSPKKASQRIAHLGHATRQVIYISAIIFLVGVLLVAIYLALGIYLEDKILGICLLINSVSLLIRGMGIVRGNKTYQMIGDLGFYIISAILGISLAHADNNYYWYLLPAAAFINAAGLLVRFYNKRYRGSEENPNEYVFESAFSVAFVLLGSFFLFRSEPYLSREVARLLVGIAGVAILLLSLAAIKTGDNIFRRWRGLIYGVVLVIFGDLMKSDSDSAQGLTFLGNAIPPGAMAVISTLLGLGFASIFIARIIKGTTETSEQKTNQKRDRASPSRNKSQR